MFKGYDIPLILLAIFICCIFSRIIMGIFTSIYDIAWKKYEDNPKVNYYLFKSIWFILSAFVLFFILWIGISFISLIVQQ